MEFNVLFTCTASVDSFEDALFDLRMLVNVVTRNLNVDSWHFSAPLSLNDVPMTHKNASRHLNPILWSWLLNDVDQSRRLSNQWRACFSEKKRHKSRNQFHLVYYRRIGCFVIDTLGTFSKTKKYIVSWIIRCSK